MSPMLRPVLLPTAVLALALALAGCGSARYAGTMVTEQGACGLGFDSAGKSAATLIVQGADVQFVPADGVLMLSGHISPSGHVVASSMAPGADRKPFQQVFEGDRGKAGDQVAGHFATPRCRAAVTLARR